MVDTPKKDGPKIIQQKFDNVFVEYKPVFDNLKSHRLSDRYHVGKGSRLFMQDALDSDSPALDRQVAGICVRGQIT